MTRRLLAAYAGGIRHRVMWAVGALCLVASAVAAFATIGTAAADAGACTAGAECLAVHLPESGGEVFTEYFTVSRITSESDVHAQPYPVLYGDGSYADPTPDVTGLSLQSAISEAYQDDPKAAGNPTHPSFVTVSAAGGEWTEPLSSGDLDGTATTDALLPVVGTYSNQLTYYRPQRDDTDVNAPDVISAATQGPQIDVTVHTGQQFSVQATASTTRPTVGHQVDFTATNTASGGQRPVSIVWNFGDGVTATGSSVSHTFTAAAQDTVVATGTGADDSGGQDVVTEKVRCPSSGACPTSTSTPPSNPTTTPPTPTRDPAPSTTRTIPPTDHTKGGDGGSASGDLPPMPASGTPPSYTSGTGQNPAVAPEAGGVIVGQLLSDPGRMTTLSQPGSARVASQRPGADLNRSGDGEVATRAAAIGVPVALFGLGAASELGLLSAGLSRSRKWRQHLTARHGRFE